MAAFGSDESEFRLEQIVGRHAVHRASVLTKDVMRSIDSFDKDDASPVTVADFAAQALIICAIKNYFPDDTFIAEESADLLRADDAASDRVWGLIQNAISMEPEMETSSELRKGFPFPASKVEMLDYIDLGSSKEGPKAGRIWILDPIDGTATFMKSQQYAVCLCLTVNGKQEVAILGCPNLITYANEVSEDLIDRNHYGVIVSAKAGAGCYFTYMRKRSLGSSMLIQRPRELKTNNLRLIDSSNSFHADHEAHRKVIEDLHLTKESLELWSQQMKYVALALGAGDAMTRIPHRLDYRACVWDHAGGQLIYQETGGKITDINGQPFEYGTFRRFQNNCGYIAADPAVHDTILDIVQKIVAERKEGP